jgi:hypothetical protein
MTPKSNEDIIRSLKLDDKIKDILISKGFKFHHYTEITDPWSFEKVISSYIFKKDGKRVVFGVKADTEYLIKYLNNF